MGNVKGGRKIFALFENFSPLTLELGKAQKMEFGEFATLGEFPLINPFPVLASFGIPQRVKNAPGANMGVWRGNLIKGFNQKSG